MKLIEAIGDMRILTYKRTHTGDPDRSGVFGEADCMGQIRGFGFDAVIGIGGMGAEACSHGIDHKINWVGIRAMKSESRVGRAPTVTFERFLLFENRGPLFHDLAPCLARRMYGKSAPRFLLDNYSSKQKEEAVNILKWAIQESPESLPATSTTASERKSCESSRVISNGCRSAMGQEC